MTAIHLSAKHGHTNILEALKGHVSWRITSKKVIKFDSPKIPGILKGIYIVSWRILSKQVIKNGSPKYTLYHRLALEYHC